MATRLVSRWYHAAVDLNTQRHGSDDHVVKASLRRPTSLAIEATLRDNSGNWFSMTQRIKDAAGQPAG